MKKIIVLLTFLITFCTSQEKRAMEYNLYRATISAAEALLQLRETGEAKENLRSAPVKFRGWEWSYLDRLSDASTMTFRAHSGGVASVAVSPDGAMIASGSADSTIRLWSTDGKEIGRLSGHHGQVSTLDFSSDGTLLASGSTDKSVKVWDVKSRKEIRTLTDGLSQGVYCVKFHPDGKKIGTASWDFTRAPFRVYGFAAIHDLETGKRLNRFEGTAHPLSSIDFSSDGKKLLTGDWGMLLQILDVDSGRQLVKIDIDDRDDYRAIQSVAFSPDESRFCAVGKDNRIRAYSTSSGELLRTIESWEGHIKDVNTVAYSPDGKYFATGSADLAIIVWDADTFRKVNEFLGHTAPVSSLSFSPDSKTLYSASRDNTVKAWDVERHRRTTFDVMQSGPWSAPVSPDGLIFAAAGSDAEIGIWKTTGEKIGAIPNESGNYAAFSSDGSYLVVGNHTPQVILWDLRSMQEVRRYNGHTNSIFSVDISAAKKLIVSGSSDKSVRVWNLHDTVVVKEFQFEKIRPQYVKFSPSGAILAAGATDGSITVWETTGWKKIAEMKNSGGVTNLAFSADGSMLLAGGDKGICTVWDMKKFLRLHELKEHAAFVFGTGFHPDNSRIVTSSYDQSVKIWDTKTGECVLTIRNFPKELYTASFFNGGKSVLVTQTDGVVHILTIE